MQIVMYSVDDFRKMVDRFLSAERNAEFARRVWQASCYCWPCSLQCHNQGLRNKYVNLGRKEIK